ncbi:MAG TPA: RnfABCDGE type electron transport complex subunit D [bacterium]|nr:RnfABCDGE type electron transport complex subunit D [bacterium]
MAKKVKIEVPEQYQVRLSMSASPHIRSSEDVPRVMLDVLIALTPAILGAVYYFRFKALSVMLACIIAAVATEFICSKWLFGKRVMIDDWSAVLAGILLAFCLPPGIPIWAAAIGGFCAVFFGKMLFGGLGQNIFNPALVGRAILLASWPVSMTTWEQPIDGVTMATPLGIIKEGLADVVPPTYFDLLTGNVAGSLGETSAVLLLIGAVYLFYRKIITWHVPFTFIAVVLVGSAFAGRDPVYELLSGGLILGAFFMATDMVTSPVTPLGRILFGAGCGLLTFIIRNFGGYPEGVCYAILIMNATVPLIDKYTLPKEFGQKGRKAK